MIKIKLLKFFVVIILVFSVTFNPFFFDTASATNLSQNLGGLWRLNEGGGTIASDSSGNSRNGVVTGATWTAGKLDNGLSLNGAVRDYVQINGLIGSSTNITVAAWANLTSADTKGAEIISLGDAVGLRIDRNDPPFPSGIGGFYHYVGNWRSTYYSTNYAGTGWHHFAYVINDTGNSQKLYVDGALASTTSHTESISYNTGGVGTDTFIGRHGDGETTYDFNGLIDDVRVYNVALSDSDIQSLYAAGPASGGNSSIKTRIKALLRFRGGLRFR